MKFKLILFLVLICSNVIIGQKIIEDEYYYSNGQINIKKTYKLGEEDKNLIIEEYYSDGKLQLKVIISNDGENIKYDYNGYFNNGKLSRSGVMIGKVNYIRDGVEKFIERSFSIDEIIYNCSGKVVEYYDNGQLYYEKSYKFGLVDGESITYFKNGQIQEKGVYDRTSKKGEWITYFENGKIESKKYYQ